MSEQYDGDFYCLKCKKTVKAVGEISEVNNRRMAKAVCPECGTKMTRILAKPKP